jgi:hypothetical protein
MRISTTALRYRAIGAIAALLVVYGSSALADTIAYQVPGGVVGNQLNGANISFGMDFDVNSPITVDQIGVFDSSQDGLIAQITAAIYDRTSQSLVSPVVTFAAGAGAGSGTLVGGSRFLSIAPLSLPAGFHGAIITYGYGNGISAEPDGNSFGAATGTPSFPWTVNSGGGLISFVGAGRYSNGEVAISYPLNIDSGPVNRYAAGTFAFASVPEPSAVLLALLGLVGLTAMGWHRRKPA